MKTSQIQHFLAVLMYNLFYVQPSLAGTKQCCAEDVYVNCNNQPLYNITNKLPLHGVSWLCQIQATEVYRKLSKWECNIETSIYL